MPRLAAASKGQPSSSAEMSKSSPFDLLPAELVAYVFELATAIECAEYNHVPNEDQSKEFFGPTLLASIHTSVRIRRINLAHQPLWRAMVDKLIKSRLLSKSIRAKLLFEFCAEQSGHTLSKMSFTAFGKQECIKWSLDLLATTTLSACSLQKLTIFEDFLSRPDSCKCRDCGRMADEGGQHYASDKIWTALFTLFREAVALKSLDLLIPTRFPLPPKTLQEARGARSQPQDVSLRIPRGALPSQMVEWMLTLASQAEELWLALRDEDVWPSPIGTSTNAISMVGQAARSTLRSLTLEEALGGDIVELLQCDLPMLEDLCLVWDAIAASAPASQVDPIRNRIESLDSFVGPCWLFRFIETPNLLQSSVLVIQSTEEDILISSLLEWKQLQTLLIRTPDHELDAASKIIQRTLRALTPSSGKVHGCPNLLHLGINNGDFPYLEWLTDHRIVLEDDQDEQDWTDAPVIGFDIFRLDQRRRQASATVTPTQLESKCRPLETIRIRNFLVDPMAWTLILESSEEDKDEVRLCDPDPVDLRQDLIHEGEQDLDPEDRVLPRLSATLYTINAS